MQERLPGRRTRASALPVFFTSAEMSTYREGSYTVVHMLCSRTRALTEKARETLLARVAVDGVLRSSFVLGVAPGTLRRAVAGAPLMRNVARKLEEAL